MAVSAAGPDPKYKAPRTESGQPDLQGVWNFSSEVPLQRPEAVADKKTFTREEFEARKGAKARGIATISTLAPVEAIGLTWLDYAPQIEDVRTSLITYPENGKLPKLVDGVRRVPGADEILAALADIKGGPPPAVLQAFLSGGKRDGPEDFGTSERCLFGGGPPFMPDVDNNYVQVIQSNDHVVLLTDKTARIVPLTGRPRLSGNLRIWAGDSRGHWEGDTLVVETSNFTNRTQSFAGAGTAREKVVTERLTRISPHALSYEATVVDPKTFQDKIVFTLPMTKVESHLYESACHEGNYSMSNVLAAARKEEGR